MIVGRVRIRAGCRPDPDARPDELQRRRLPLDFPEGTFDAIVCSDVVYLWERRIVGTGLSTMVDRLRPGGALVLLHYLGTFGRPIHANDVHDPALELGAAAGLEHPAGYVHVNVGPHGAGFRVDVLTSSARR